MSPNDSHRHFVSPLSIMMKLYSRDLETFIDSFCTFIYKHMENEL